MTMTMRTIAAGQASDRLIEQVFPDDDDRGTWVGSGLAGLGVVARSAVTAGQVRSLFGTGRHPDAERLRQQAAQAGLGPADQDRASRLGTSRHTTAGFDLVLSPETTFLASRASTGAIEAAHHRAVDDALALVERHVLYAREGGAGVRQVDVLGLVAVQLTHRDRRARACVDRGTCWVPARSSTARLHTHVVVANKVQTRASRRWLELDAGSLYAAVPVVSETYDTAMDQHLREALGVSA